MEQDHTDMLKVVEMLVKRREAETKYYLAIIAGMFVVVMCTIIVCVI
jgi:hypothetical protein